MKHILALTTLAAIVIASPAAAQWNWWDAFQHQQQHELEHQQWHHQQWHHQQWHRHQQQQLPWHDHDDEDETE